MVNLKNKVDFHYQIELEILISGYDFNYRLKIKFRSTNAIL